MERLFDLIEAVGCSAAIQFLPQSEPVDAIRPLCLGGGLQTPIATRCQSEKRRMELGAAGWQVAAIGRSSDEAFRAIRHPRELRQHDADDR
jgi:hypothetical protein